MNRWLKVRRGAAPLSVSIPHAGTEIPPHLEGRFEIPWLATRDADWWVDRLYAFAEGLDATVIATALSRSVIDVNRDPSGASLYPGQATTELCPTTTFDGEALYRAGHAPDEAEIAIRRQLFFQPYHDALADEINRLRAGHARVVLYDAHSIRSVVPRLFEGELPQFNIGTNAGASCDPALTAAVEGRAMALGPAGSPTAVSRAATSPAITARRPRASTPSRWSWPAAAIWPSPEAVRRRTTGPRRSSPASPRRWPRPSRPPSPPASISPGAAHDPPGQFAYYQKPARH